MKFGKHTVSQGTVALRQQLLDSNSPTNVMQQVLTDESGVSFSKGFYTNTVYTPNEHAKSSADKLLQFLASQY